MKKSPLYVTEACVSTAGGFSQRNALMLTALTWSGSTLEIVENGNVCQRTKDINNFSSRRADSTA